MNFWGVSPQYEYLGYFCHSSTHNIPSNIMARLYIFISVFAVLAMLIHAQPNQMSCQLDSDCACGVNKTTGICAYGNYKYVDTTKHCPGTTISLR